MHTLDSRILSANPPCSPLPLPKYSSSTYGNTKLVYTRALIWACSRQSSKSILDYLVARRHRTGAYVYIIRLSLSSGYDSTNGRTLLLFVIRDHIGTTPLANLQATLTADLQRIWDSLSKPDELKDRQLTDYFDLGFTALPHKILATDQFELETRNLRGRFVDKTKSDYLFKPIYHKRIPADGVAFYMENIWVRSTHSTSQNTLSYFAA